MFFLSRTAAALAALAALMLPSPALAQAGGNWIATGWNIHLLHQADPGTAGHFFNAPSSSARGSDPTASPVKDGFATSAVLAYTSYAQFAADIADGAITYHWVLYDPEEWPATPLAEQQDPGTYLRLFGQLAHANGYQVIETPARDLGNTATACAKQPGETNDQWYIRCDIAGAAAACSDTVAVQDQANTADLAGYRWLFTSAQAQAQAANPSALVDAEVSTSYGTPAQMAAAAQSVAASGYYVSMTSGTITQADQFFQAMQAAGY